MNKPIARLPVVAAMPFAHLTLRLYAVPGGGLSFGMVPTAAPAGAPVEMCGFADRGTADELRQIADAIEGASA
jgi:hypothetical protein